METMAKTQFVNTSAGIQRWHTGPQAVQAYTYVPADSKIPNVGEAPEGEDPIVYVKLFDPTGSWSWYLLEANRETGEAFGWVVGFESELGYIDLNELAEVRGKFGLPIERDIHFTPCALSVIRKGQG